MLQLFAQIAHAQEESEMLTVSAVVGRIHTYVVNPLIVLLFAIGLMMFLWGVMTFLTAKATGGESTKMEDGKRHMLWGIIGMTIMVSVWGIVRILLNTLGIDYFN